MITQTAGHTDIRATNLAAVLGFLRREAPCSRAAIASGTGLNKATVTSIVGDLLERRLVRETQQTQNHVGRPATLLVLDGSAYAAVGLEVSANGLSALAFDTAGDQLLRWHRAGPGADAGPAKTIAALAVLARRAISTVQSSGREVLGITVGVPGLIDRDGVVVLAAGLGWRDVRLRTELTAALGRPDIPVAVDNDANLGALADQLHGPFAGCDNLIHLTGDTGIGAGVIADGRLLRGDLGYAGEIGHLRLVADGPLCGCGRRGCLEALAGLPAILSRSDPAADPDPQVQLEHLIRRAEAGEAAVTKILAEAGTHLGNGIAALVNVLNPAAITLGGSYALLADHLIPSIEQVLSESVITPDAGGCTIAPSAFPRTATTLGAAAHSLISLNSGRLPKLTVNS
ncbi:putative NBD/HSP70 family sugar kinase [Kribbella sp. VKM Ac-2527]|uniref:Putative NBD/HSP70 family sugar kinase n=1 Tax=Kribbella caucasensis TaxID=2512215 RepID=A0A4R6K6P6_9ACTN|nr:ROK family transcriptional regulator [Kribbella sp. VKM Ac-2527]TDO44001.1 putative NBD/HSP70 family sugar kinase [Kribbella sp. VKM Ac-2527]